jgi:hypothetical protein
MKAQKLSQFVVSDLRSWMEINYDRMSVRPRDTTTDTEKKTFWVYHHKFPLEFVTAINEALDGYKFVSYDHLNNRLECLPL